MVGGGGGGVMTSIARNGIRSSARKRRAEAMMLPGLPLLLALIHDVGG
jgi:hypothetical protein